ncbi:MULTISPECIES: TonB-dependent receptor domain-containing protein [Aequorivita]|uniref:Outer membrane beta-barrel protein n=1 Tax=Aequorivita iocasae TaxID=2803865 RepID=A0ABX7DVP1_9FLAO|nr:MULTISPECIES: TonB-dependent receptor [Aequorivita]QQX77648.1 outer membrane beta-barrel protein [Aequorivita iocasae]UCA57146.1 outer membrane beta-barrel protein [Aequorivita sp. F7]
MFFFCLQAGVLMAQDFSVSGSVLDTKNAPLSFVNVLVYENEGENPLIGTTTDEDGSFVLKNLEAGTYIINFSYIGFEDKQQTIQLSSNKNLGNLVLQENQQMLDETVVVAKLPTIRKTPGKLVFEVENTSLSTGSAVDLLKKTPGVIVANENIQIKLSTPVIYINGKRVYLSAEEVYSLLQNTDAAAIKSVEVITNPSSKYDADAGTVLNIITSKAISIGYKGSVYANYEQGIYPKYNFGTSHFYKNNWVNMYASYSYADKKEYKEDENYIRYFQPDEASTKSIWETDFNRTTERSNHNGNVVLDFTLNDKNTISLTSNVSLTPEVKYHNNGHSLIFSPQRQLDSTITTLSYVDYEKQNLTFALDYNRALNENGATLAISANYIYYDNIQNQSVSSDYLLPNGNLLRNNSFYTDSEQTSDIFTGQADVSSELWGGTFEAGFKFSSIDTESKLDFFDVLSNTTTFNNSLSDNFNYRENIFAEYINFEKDWEKWSVAAGLRGEYTDIDAISHSLGQVNNKQYFDLFPSASFHYIINDNNGIGLSYSRSVERPRYQSLNPFKYFITERNFNGGNPKLVPAIEDKITLTFGHKGKLFFELYYQNVENSLDILVLQNNTNSTLSSIDANMIKSYQYAFDITYFSSLNPWWWLHLNTSSFYLANEFYALQSSPETYTNDTFGQYIFLTNHFTLSKDRSFTADLTGVYISNFVFGNRFFENQSYVNVLIRKDIWDKNASLTVGVDDLFNTLNNTASVSNYYNQDNYYYANIESRLLRLGFKYNFGNSRLRDNSKKIETDEGDRLEGE